MKLEPVTAVVEMNRGVYIMTRDGIYTFESALIGFDIDGTIAAEWRSTIFGRICAFLINHLVWFPGSKLIMKIFMGRIGLIMRPLVPHHLVTSRLEWAHRTTRKWLVKHNINPAGLHLAPCYGKNRWAERATRKAAVIRDLGLDYYFEDEPKTRYLLKLMLPKVNVLPPDAAIKLGYARWGKDSEFWM